MGWISRGSPYSSASPFVDVLQFPAVGGSGFVDAVGGNDAASAARMGGAFVDHLPFTGTGFVPSARLIPLWWAFPTRIPAGSALIRHFPDGKSAVIAAYSHVGVGWQIAPGASAPQRGVHHPSDVLGLYGEYAGERWLVDRLADGRIVLCSRSERPGWAVSARGLWYRLVEPSEMDRVYGMRVEASWRGLRFQVVDRAAEGTGVTAALVYIGHDAIAAETAQLAKTDQGVYEVAVPWAELTDISASEIEIPRAIE